jgi:hypothetical protein
MPTAAKTSTACEIAGISAAKFNGLIATGEYPCPPPTVAGSTRIFEIDDIVALFIFARLLDHGFKSKIAGRFACKARYVAECYPNQDQVTFAWNMNGLVSPVAPDADLADGYISGGPVMFKVTWDFRNIRQIVQRALDDANRIARVD